MAMAAERADWAVGYQDETWWSRSAHPPFLRSWAEKGQCLKLHEHAEDANDPEPKAIACYGIAIIGMNRRSSRKPSGCGLWKAIRAAS